MANSILDKALASPKLPTLPAVAMQVLQLTRDRNVDLKKLASAIRHDQALAMKVLRTVNSSYYGLSKPCVTIHQALIYLGVNTVKTIALGFTLTDSLNDEQAGGFDFAVYWRRALSSAAAAREIATATGACDPEESFLAALVQDLGMVALHRTLGDAYVDLLRRVGNDHRALAPLERQELGVEHGEVGSVIAERWGLPDSLVQGVRYHERAEEAPPEWRALARAVELAGVVAHVLSRPDADLAASPISRLATRWFDLRVDETRSIVHATRRAIGELSALFRLGTEGRPNTDAILEAAEEQLTRHQIEMERRTEALRISNAALQHQSTTDALTGLANRGWFDREVSEAFAAVQSGGGSLGLIFGDLDRFKAINDTYGHQVGDAVLASVARTMREIVGDAGMAARYGGEEFAIILPGADREQASRLAERIRHAIASTPVDASSCAGAGRTVSVMMSLGVASYGPETASVLHGSEMLIRAADQAVYAAKSAGRNCVRVFQARARPSAA